MADDRQEEPSAPSPLFRKPLALSESSGTVAVAFAGVAELADALDSKSSDRKIVWVRAPPPAITRVLLLALTLQLSSHVTSSKNEPV